MSKLLNSFGKVIWKKHENFKGKLCDIVDACRPTKPGPKMSGHACEHERVDHMTWGGGAFFNTLDLTPFTSHVGYKLPTRSCIVYNPRWPTSTNAEASGKDHLLLKRPERDREGAELCQLVKLEVKPLFQLNSYTECQSQVHLHSGLGLHFSMKNTSLKCYFPQQMDQMCLYELSRISQDNFQKCELYLANWSISSVAADLTYSG